MIAALIANIGVFVAVVVAGFAIDRRLRSETKLKMLPWYLQWLVGGLAISPIVFFEDQLAVGLIDGLVVGFAVSVVFWIALPTVFSQLVSVDETAGLTRC